MGKGKVYQPPSDFYLFYGHPVTLCSPQQNGESRMNNDRRILDYTPFCIQFCGVLGILE